MNIIECIEGIPVIIRFKTLEQIISYVDICNSSIEGIPVIIRFKTELSNVHGSDSIRY